MSLAYLKMECLNNTILIILNSLMKCIITLSDNK